MSPRLLLLAALSVASTGNGGPGRGAATPADHSLWFSFRLGDAPVGLVELRREGSTYRYRSVQFFARAGAFARRAREVAYELAEGPRVLGHAEPPSGLALWQRPALGCQKVHDELSGRVGELCVEAQEPVTRGSLLGQSFEAVYDGAGVLRELRLGAASFERRQLPTLPPMRDPWGQGFAVGVGEGPLRLDPPRPLKPPLVRGFTAEGEARALAQRVFDSFPSKNAPAFEAEGTDEVTDGNCLAHARRYARWSGGRAAVVYGVLLDGASAYPHAWVSVRLPSGRLLELDPSSLAEVGPRTHLALGAPHEAALLYVELLAGERRVRR